MCGAQKPAVVKAELKVLPFMCVYSELQGRSKPKRLPGEKKKGGPKKRAIVSKKYLFVSVSSPHCQEAVA